MPLLLFILLIEITGVLIIAVRAMPASALAAIAAPEMILLGKYNIAFGAQVIIFGVKLLFEHALPKIRNAEIKTNLTLRA